MVKNLIAIITLSIGISFVDLSANNNQDPLPSQKTVGNALLIQIGVYPKYNLESEEDRYYYFLLNPDELSIGQMYSCELIDEKIRATLELIKIPSPDIYLVHLDLREKGLGSFKSFRTIESLKRSPDELFFSASLSGVRSILNAQASYARTSTSISTRKNQTDNCSITINPNP